MSEWPERVTLKGPESPRHSMGTIWKTVSPVWLCQAHCWKGELKPRVTDLTLWIQKTLAGNKRYDFVFLPFVLFFTEVSLSLFFVKKLLLFCVSGIRSRIDPRQVPCTVMFWKHNLTVHCWLCNIRRQWNTVEKFTAHPYVGEVSFIWASFPNL